MLTLLHRFAHARILVVDDDLISCHLITDALNRAGFRKIEVAHDGKQALGRTYDFKPDLVILDLQMPHLDGFGYCENVRSDAELPRMPIIVQTISDEREAKLRALSCGADDFLHKPLDMEELNLRATIQLERYFMLQDLHHMCGYLKMELTQMKETMRQGDMAPLPDKVLRMLNRHYEVLETMTLLPASTG